MSSPKPWTVMIVDDHPESRMIYEAVLQHAGYRTITAGDGAEGLRLAKERLPDVMIADLHMPLLDGCDLIEALKRDPSTAHMRTILLTADVRDEVRQRAIDAGCDRVFTKPYAPLQLASAARDLLGVTGDTAGGAPAPPSAGP
jgi:CheY-like chemotaxis protein